MNPRRDTEIESRFWQDNTYRMQIIFISHINSGLKYERKKRINNSGKSGCIWKRIANQEPLRTVEYIPDGRIV